MKIIQKIAHRSNFGKTRSTIKFIVIHYTANDGDKAWNNANYFQTALPSGKKASAHYFVDDSLVYQSVPDNYVAYAVGANYADKSKGGGKYYGICKNDNSISIELCDTNKDGSIYPTQATINLAIELTRSLMEKYNIDTDHVLRHFDVTGKECPKYWINDSKWRTEFKDKLTVVGWSKDEKGWWYRYKDGTYPKAEWVEIDNKWYYFNSEGYMASNEYIKSSDYNTNKKLYWLDPTGAWNNKSYKWMNNYKGWWIQEVGGSWYPKNEWAKIDNKWYYFDESGYMVANRIKTIDGNVYQFRTDGSLI